MLISGIVATAGLVSVLLLVLAGALALAAVDTAPFVEGDLIVVTVPPFLVMTHVGRSHILHVEL